MKKSVRDVKARLSVSPEQLKLMSFGPRRQIIAALANDPSLSARQLADRLHKPVTGLYRHIDLLLDAGLVQQSGEKAGPRRPEALYELTFSSFSSDAATKSSGGRAAVSQAAARYALATSRKVSRAIENDTARLNTADANTGFYVLDLQLNRAGLIAFHQLLDKFIASARELRVRERDALETIAVTILIAPES